MPRGFRSSRSYSSNSPLAPARSYTSRKSDPIRSDPIRSDPIRSDLVHSLHNPEFRSDLAHSLALAATRFSKLALAAAGS